mgnify:CR=1 FL=1
MAGVSMKDIKSRIKSMESTKQITKAMEMVAASKLRGAQDRAVSSRPYFETLYETMNSIADSTMDFVSPYLSAGKGKPLYIVIAGDRGLAGGYNANVLKLAYSQIQNTDAIVLPIGKKSVDFFRTRDVALMTESCAVAAELSVGRCYSVAKQICSRFLAGEFSEVVLVYTHFASLLAQTPITLPLLPIKISDHKDLTPKKFVLYETGPIAVFNAIIPEYLGGLVYGALCESVASEQAARRMAMDSATKNAEDMIDSLSLQYNRARQGAITQEITEIVAGADSN